jgi:osmotically-inducible protein OsmY
VTVSQGTATLQGSVRDQNQKQQAEQIAQSISGIENVQNNLTVSGRPSTTGQQPTYGQQSTTGQMGQSQTGFQQTSTSDKVLAYQVALELQQQMPSSEIVYVLDPQAINVMVSEGTVMLHGTAPDQHEAAGGADRQSSAGRIPE